MRKHVSAAKLTLFIPTYSLIFFLDRLPSYIAIAILPLLYWYSYITVPIIFSVQIKKTKSKYQ